MALAMPLPGGVKTQPFGLSAMLVQPAMWYVGSDKAWWHQFPGATWAPHVHAGVDFAGRPAGSALVAAERGTVTRADYDRYNGGGWVVEVEIRPGVRYSYNHCQSLLAAKGDSVEKGERIANVGATGTIWTGSGFVRSSYGVHVHALLTITEHHSDGFSRPMLHDFADFMSGGSRAASPLIKPIILPDTSVVRGVLPVSSFTPVLQRATIKAGKPRRIWTPGTAPSLAARNLGDAKAGQTFFAAYRVPGQDFGAGSGWYLGPQKFPNEPDPDGPWFTVAIPRVDLDFE